VENSKGRPFDSMSVLAVKHEDIEASHKGQRGRYAEHASHSEAPLLKRTILNRYNFQK
jgi:hypothetical protein